MYFALDAGHGEGSKTTGVYDPGAMLQGYEEHKLATGIVEDLEAALVALGHRVYRPTGLFTTRDDKARAAGVDFYLSIHFNGGPGTGSEAFVNRTSATPQAKAFAADVSARLAKIMGIPDRGLKYADWAVLSANKNDALVEVCFPADVKKYLANKDAVTLAILNALLKANGFDEVASLEGGTDMLDCYEITVVATSTAALARLRAKCRVLGLVDPAVIEVVAGTAYAAKTHARKEPGPNKAEDLAEWVKTDAELIAFKGIPTSAETVASIGVVREGKWPAPLPAASCDIDTAGVAAHARQIIEMVE